jgi:DNA adenine methylase
VKTPLAWFGGKAHAVAWYLPYLPPHHTYVEVFGGMAAVLFAKAPAPVEVYNDVDAGLVTFFRVLRDPEQCRQLETRLALTPYSRAEHAWSRATWQHVDDPIERAARWVVQLRQAFSAVADGTSGWSFCVTETARGMAKAVARWHATLDALLPCGARLVQVQIECADWRQILATYDTPQTLFFCDPPYLPATRRQGGYVQELTADDHRELLARLQQVAGMVLLCGYPHPSYAVLEAAGWTCTWRKAVASAPGRTRWTGLQGQGSARGPQTRIECLWRNPAACQTMAQLPLFASEPTPWRRKAHDAREGQASYGE